MIKLSHEERVKKAILKGSRLKRIPRSDNKVVLVFHTCGNCKKNRVTNHHYLCDSCWKENKYKEKYGDKK